MNGTLAASEWMNCQAENMARMQLSRRLKRAIALRVAQMQESEYGLAFHGAEAAREDIPEADAQNFRRGIADDPKEQTVLALVSKVLRDHGRNAALAIESARALGVTDADIVEIIALISMHTFANHLAGASQVFVDPPQLKNVDGSLAAITNYA